MEVPANIFHLLMPLALALVAASSFTWLAVRVCTGRGWTARPRTDRWHKGSPALYGGVAIFAAFLLTAGLLLPRESRVLWRLVGIGSFVFAVGLLDDVVSLRPLLKFGLQAVAAALALSSGAVYPLSTHPALNVVVSAVWIIGVTNALNLLDNMDGLSAGTAIIAAVYLAAIFTLLSSPANVVVMLALAGAAAGFLLFNFKPARIFMGDSGSLFLGFMLGSCSLLNVTHLTGFSAFLLVPVLVLAIPLFDTFFVSITRRLRGQAISQGGTDHSSHRLVRLGLDERNAVLVLYSLSVISGGIALLIRFFSPANAIGLTVLWMLFLFLFGIHLFHTEPKVEEAEDVQFAFVKRLKHRDTLALLVDFVFLAFAYYAAFIIAFKGNVPPSDLRLFVHSLPLVLGAKFAMLWAVGTYASSWWRGSRKDLYRVVQGVVVGEVVAILLLVLLYRFEGFSRAVFVLDALLSAFFLVSFRRSFYVFRDLVHTFRGPGPGRARVLIVGTWHGADLACRFLAEQNLDCVGLIDLNGGMDTGRVVWGLPVLGRVADIPLIASYNFLDAVVLAEPVDPSALLAESCRRSNLPLYLFGLRENNASGVQQRPELVWRNPMRTGRAAGD